MSIRYGIDPALRIVRFRHTGVITDELPRLVWHRMIQDPDYVPGMHQLHDARDVTRYEVSSRTVRSWRAAARGLEDLRGTRIAGVAPQDVVFGLGRMFELLCDGLEFEIRVFREVAEAEGWLGADGQ